MLDVKSARIEWAERVAQQSKELRIIARATNDNQMRDELRDYAERLDEQAARIMAAIAVA